MEETLFSASWYRVADIKPLLRSHVQIHRHSYRRQDWHVLQDHVTGRFHRFSPEAYLIIGLMDGRRTLQEIWESACEKLGDHMPAQDEVINLLSQLHRANVLQSDMPPDFSRIHERHTKMKRSRLLGYIRSPMAVKFPLIDPDRFLERTVFLIRPFLGWAGFILWLTVVVSALFLAAMHWKDLTSNLTDRVLGTENLVLLWFTYPLVKLFHEFGHAYTVKRWGGEVHEMGVMFLVFMPIPYVDASSSSAFKERGRRMLVGASGIMVELFLAALAMIFWVDLEPGTARAVAFNIMLIGGVSTVLFNGNPLLRFDAYYVLSDYLEIPNMGARSNQFIGYVLKRRLLGVKELISPAQAPGEAGWLGFYALASFVYRIFISVRIVLFVASKFFVVGVVLAGWALVSMLVIPLVHVIRTVLADSRLRRKRVRIMAACAAAGGVAALIFLVIPAPMFTVAEGVIWVSEDSRVHAGTDGFIVGLQARSGQKVNEGDVLITCDDPELMANVKIFEARLNELKAQLRAAVQKDRTEAGIVRDEIDRVEGELRLAREKQNDLLIRSPAGGVFIVQQEEDLPGRFVRRGTPIGYVVDFPRVTVRSVVPQSRINDVRSHTMKVEARLSENIASVLPASIIRQVPAASKELPSLALSVEGGGAIALDPREKDGPRAFETIFQFDIELTAATVHRIGERVYVRFEHDPEPLGFRWYRNIRRLFLRRFDV